jgi:hypothetical protein
MKTKIWKRIRSKRKRKSKTHAAGSAEKITPYVQV